MVLTAASPANARAFGRDVDRGNVRVTVGAVSHLEAGQTVPITLEARNGTTLNMVSVNQCSRDTLNWFEFSTDGGLCAESPLSDGHMAQWDEGPLGPGVTRVEIPYRVGAGTQQVDDMFDARRELACAPGRPCFLALYIQESKNPDVQLSIPIAFGPDESPAERDAGAAIEAGSGRGVVGSSGAATAVGAGSTGDAPVGPDQGVEQSGPGSPALGTHAGAETGAGSAAGAPDGARGGGAPVVPALVVLLGALSGAGAWAVRRRGWRFS